MSIDWTTQDHFLPPVHKPEHQTTTALHIPRPVLTVVQVRDDNSPPPSSSESCASSSSSNYIYDGRCDTPTRFTLLGQSGVIHRNSTSTPTICQLSMMFCTLALLALVGMIVYMEVYMKESNV